MTRLIRLAADIWVRSSDHWEANAALIAADPETLLVVDPGVLPAEVAELRALAAEMAPHARITAVFTHSHYDHMIGWQELDPQAVIASRPACDRDPAAAREEVSGFDAKSRISRGTAWDYPPRSLLFAPDSLVPPGRYDISGLRFTFHAAPGHTADSQFVVVPNRRLMFAGDYLSNLFFPMIFSSAAAYLDSLDSAQRLVDEYALELLVPGHGLPATTASEVNGRLADDRAYVQALIAGATDALAKGLSPDEAQPQRDEVHYRGEPIDPYFAGNHRRNFALAYSEAAQRGRA